MGVQVALIFDKPQSLFLNLKKTKIQIQDFWLCFGGGGGGVGVGWGWGVCDNSKGQVEFFFNFMFSLFKITFVSQKNWF